MKNKYFGLPSDVYGIKHSLKTSLTHLSKVGVKYVEIVSGHISKITGGSFSKSSIKKLDKAKKVCSDLGIGVQQVHGPYGGNDLVANSEKERKKNVDIYKGWIDCANALGAHALIVHIGSRSDLCKCNDRERLKEKNAESISELAKHIGKGHLFLALENIPRHSAEHSHIYCKYGNNVSELKELLSILKSDRCGICLDTGHGNIENIHIPSAVREAGKDLVATHINENNGVYDMHMFPFSLRPRYSKMDWFEIFKSFKEIDYPYPLIGECANSTGEYPLWFADSYIKNQKELIECVLKKI
jgi:sugar phosphate isomerase/epimerase